MKSALTSIIAILLSFAGKSLAEKSTFVTTPDDAVSGTARPIVTDRSIVQGKSKNQIPKNRASRGYFTDGIPYTRIGNGPRVLIVLWGLSLSDNKPLSGMALGIYGFLKKRFTIYGVLPKSGLPAGYSLKEMANDYAIMIRKEFVGSVDVIGISTGGSIAHYLAADHPELVRRLVIHSSAYTLGSAGKAIQHCVAELVKNGHWIRANAALCSFMMPRNGIGKVLSAPVVGLCGFFGGVFGIPKKPSDVLITIHAEDTFNFKRRLSDITVPTLLVAGTADPFYTEELFRETAAGIPNCKIKVYPNMGHPAMGKQFKRNVETFLDE